MNAIRTLAVAAVVASVGAAAACAPDALPPTAASPAVERREGPATPGRGALLAALADTTADALDPLEGPLLGLGMLGSGGRSTDDRVVE
jgi:hypothetical protein